MGRRKSAGSVVHLEAHRAAQAEQPAQAQEVEPLYGVALLRIALELKRPGEEGLDAIVRRVAARMGLEEAPFRAYLENNGGLLRTLAQPKA